MPVKHIRITLEIEEEIEVAACEGVELAAEKERREGLRDKTMTMEATDVQNIE